MNKEKISEKLNELFSKKIIYSGEFHSLFILEDDKYSSKLKIKFLNQQHYDLIIKNLINDILKMVGRNVVFGHLNLKTNPISLVKPVKQMNAIKKEKVVLPTIRNQTIKEIERFMMDEYDKIVKEQLELIDEYKDKEKNLHESLRWSNNWGQITFMGSLHDFLKKIKDYEEE